MARGRSGRIVLEVDPELKKSLYLELGKKQKTLKDWFIAEAEHLIYNSKQISLFDYVASKKNIEKRKPIKKRDK